MIVLHLEAELIGEPGVKLCESIKEYYFKVGGTLSLIYVGE
jgi:hypothetical protein